MGLHIAQEIESIGFSAYWAESVRQIPDKGDLSAYWIGILSAGYLLSATPSYTSIRDLMLRLCHRLITCSIAGRGQAPKKVTVTDLFYLRGMDVGSVNIPYLLARYLRLFASGMKHGVMISWDLLVIDMAELVRLQICVELDDTWAWVAPGPERHTRVGTSASTTCSRTNSDYGLEDLAAKKLTTLMKYRSSGILCVIVVMLEYRRIYNTHPCS
ncbi:hypothetical protein Tco_0832980 [Tanacetum coccineum]